MPKFHCVNCGQHINAADEMAGTEATCPTCEAVITGRGNVVTSESILLHTFVPRPVKSRWKDCLKYSLVSFLILLVGSCMGPFATAGPADNMAGYSMSGAFWISIGVLVLAALLSITIAGIVATTAKFLFKKDFVVWASGGYIGFLLVLSSLVCVADLTGISSHGRDKNKMNHVIMDESGVWVSMNLFRINLMLPATPKVTKVSPPIENRNLLKGKYYDQALIKATDYEVVVARIERKTPSIDLEEIRRGSISDLSKVASNVRSSTGEIEITRHTALWWEAFYTVNAKEWCSRTLTFADGATLWMITVTGDANKTQQIWSKIKDSVTIGSQ